MKEIFEKLLADLVVQKILSENKKNELIKNFDAKLSEIKEAEFKKASDILEKKYKDELEKLDKEHCIIFKKAIHKLDNEHCRLFEQAMHKLDNEHCELFEQVMSKIDKDCSIKLLKVVEKLRNKNINENLVNKISDYFDTYIKESMPKSTIIDSAKLSRLEKLQENLKKLLFVSDDYVQKEIKEAVEDASKIIADKDAQINKLMLEKIEMTKKIKAAESIQFLESKTKDMNPKMKAYIETFFKNADKEDIEKKLDEAIIAFKKSENEERAKLVSEANSKKKIVKPIVYEEKEPEIKQIDEMDQYTKMLSKSFKSYKWIQN